MEPSAPVPTVQPGPSPEHPLYDANKPVRHPKLALLSLVLILAAAGGGYWYGHSGASTKTSATTSPSVVPNAVDTEAISNTVNLDYSSPVKSEAAKLSLSVPKAWRASIGSGGSSCMVDQTDYEICPAFSFANALGGSDSLVQTNSLTPMNLSYWITAPTKVPTQLGQPHLGNVYTAADKAKVIAATQALTASSKLSLTDIIGSKPTVLNPFFTNAAIVGVGNIQAIQTADGKLHGYGFIASIEQDAGYNPYAYVVLVGKAGPATMLVEGQFQINDQRRRDFDKAIAANNSAPPSWLDAYGSQAKGFSYDADSIAQFNQVLSVIKTITVN